MCIAVFQAGPPDTSKIPIADAVGVTVVLLTCSYKTKEFIRVGYYVNNEYTDPELKETPPAVPDYSKVKICIHDWLYWDILSWMEILIY